MLEIVTDGRGVSHAAICGNDLLNALRSVIPGLPEDAGVSVDIEAERHGYYSVDINGHTPLEIVWREE